MKISQRTAKISLILNVILVFMCMSLFIYALVLKTTADRNRMEAEMQKQTAIEQMDLAEKAKQRATFAAAQAEQQRKLTKQKLDSLRRVNQK